MKEKPKFTSNADRTRKTPFSALVERVRPIYSRILIIIDRRPLVSFFGLLVLVLALIIVGNMLRKPKDTGEADVAHVKEVTVFSIGSSPRVVFSGRVEKSGALKVGAQSPGIVQTIAKIEGTRVNRGETLITLSSNYQGGNLPAVSRQIAAQSYKAAEENFPKQLEMIAKRREIAEKTDASADRIREITNQSVEDTKNLISLNEQILDAVNDQIEMLEATNVGGANDALILQAKQGKAGVQAGLNGLRSGLRSSEYQAANNEPAQLSDLGREVTFKQLEVEERSLKLQKEIAALNLKVAQISESLMYPAAPCTGTVERVHVYPGLAVNPGMPLVSLSCDKSIAQVLVFVSSEVANNISRLEPSSLTIGGQTVEVMPRYISSEPTDGSLHAVIFTIPDDLSRVMTDKSSIMVSIPMGGAKTTAAVPFIPIDAVFQTQSSALVYVASASAEGKTVAHGREVTLGDVYGSYVEVRKGIGANDQVILNRNVIAGDLIQIKQ